MYPEIRAYLLASLSLRLGDSSAARLQLPGLEDPTPTPHATTVGRDAAGSIRAQLAARAGRLPDAIRALEEVHRLEARVGLIGGSPFYSQGLERFLYAELLERSARLDEAIRWYGSFASNSLFDFVYLAPSHIAGSRISRQLGRTAEAAAHFQQALDLLGGAEPEMDSLVQDAKRGFHQDPPLGAQWLLMARSVYPGARTTIGAQPRPLAARNTASATRGCRSERSWSPCGPCPRPASAGWPCPSHAP
ncbi:MAG: hypothetical protein ACREOF_05720 [Gemmatimonadales bacterium]